MQYFNLVIVFFFSSRRRHTRSKRDWSSDVCSSDLGFLSSKDFIIISIPPELKPGIVAKLLRASSLISSETRFVTLINSPPNLVLETELNKTYSFFLGK